MYREAIDDAMVPGPEKVHSGLVAITDENKNLERKTIRGEQYILVATWKKDTTYYKPDDQGFYNTRNFEIWVTTVPELKERMKLENNDDMELRLKQLLGLPPDSEYNYFIEFWVKPEDLFRPCPDPEIDDTACELCFPEKTDNYFKRWINDNRVSRYYNCDPYKKYPWTQLGYTYDWSAKNMLHIGLSEFVIGQNKEIVLHKIYSTQVYLEK